ncbi:MAG: hypothetical protein O3A87_11855, partial [Verrucomicrobia bacterium]|nr:hypothetical protein [Verrucomicrobiota bacterium]
AVGMLVLGLVSCGGGPKIGMKSPGRAFKDVRAEVSRHGGDREEVDLGRVESLLAKAAKLSSRQEEKAVGHYLQAAEEARRAGGAAGRFTLPTRWDRPVPWCRNWERGRTGGRFPERGGAIGWRSM